MKKYLLHLSIVTLIMAAVSLAVGAFAPGRFITASLLLVAYFAVITLVQHILVTRAITLDPRSAIRRFFGINLGVLALHLIVLVIYMFSHLHQPAHTKIFAIAFCIGYFVYLAFETIELVLHVRNQQKKDKELADEISSEPPIDLESK